MSYVAFTRTGLTADAYTALGRIDRSLRGPSQLFMNWGGPPVAVNETIKFWDTNVGDIERDGPNNVIPDASAQATSIQEFSTEEQERISWNISGEQELTINKNVPYQELRVRALTKAFEKAMVRIDQFAGGKCIQAGPEAYGTPGTTPFTTDIDVMNDIRKAVVRGKGPVDRRMVMDYNAYANLLKDANVSQAQQAGTASGLVEGQFNRVRGINVTETNIDMVHDQGRNADTTLAAAGAVGDTRLRLTNAAGVKPGDAFTIGDESYVVQAVDNSNNVTIAAPGLRKAQASGGSNTVQFANEDPRFSIAAAGEIGVMTVRPSAMPTDGDGARLTTIVTDPVSGFAFRLSVYGTYQMNSSFLTFVYGAKILRNEHQVALLG